MAAALPSYSGAASAVTMAAATGDEDGGEGGGRAVTSVEAVVTVPVEKHRGFVQLVREADADQAMRTGVPCGREIDLAELGEVHCRSSGPGRRAPSCRCRPAAARPCALPVVVPQQQPHQPQDQPATAATNNNVNLTPAMLGGMTQEQQPIQHRQQAVIPNRGYAPVASGIVNGSGSGNGAGSSSGGSSNGESSNSGEAYHNSYSSSPSNSTVGDAYMAGGNGGAAPQPPYTEEGLKVRRDDAGPFGYPQQRGGTRSYRRLRGAGAGARSRRSCLTPPAAARAALAPPTAPDAPATGAVRGGEVVGEAPRVVLGAVAFAVWRGAAAPERGVRAGLLPCAALAGDVRGDWDRERRRGQGEPDARGVRRRRICGEPAGVPGESVPGADAADFVPQFGVGARGGED
ncbi:hypothetical protein B0H16DRAFT_1759021 [Mycena metata]|uniref:Uncharacterized protein n=1 Tax=Mycena metata TaxID=1033252 RepID=A0AAD7MZM5_9AGAR|nr:hypothetical protein B0H16DRAFT_1759021 [Mycena metata]